MFLHKKIKPFIAFLLVFFMVAAPAAVFADRAALSAVTSEVFQDFLDSPDLEFDPEALLHSAGMTKEDFVDIVYTQLAAIDPDLLSNDYGLRYLVIEGVITLYLMGENAAVYHLWDLALLANAIRAFDNNFEYAVGFMDTNAMWGAAAALGRDAVVRAAFENPYFVEILQYHGPGAVNVLDFDLFLALKSYFIGQECGGIALLDELLGGIVLADVQGLLERMVVQDIWNLVALLEMHFDEEQRLIDNTDLHIDDILIEIDLDAEEPETRLSFGFDFPAGLFDIYFNDTDHLINLFFDNQGDSPAMFVIDLDFLTTNIHAPIIAPGQSLALQFPLHEAPDGLIMVTIITLDGTTPQGEFALRKTTTPIQ